MTVASQRIYGWAFETRIGGPVSGQSVAEAAAQYRQAGGAQVWLIDAGSAEGFAPDALSAIQQHVTAARQQGLDRVAIVLPGPAMAFLPAVKASLPVQVHGFESRGSALAWIRGGCR